MTAFEVYIVQMQKLDELNTKLIELNRGYETELDWAVVETCHKGMQDVQSQIWNIQKSIYSHNIGDTVYHSSSDKSGVVIHREINHGLPLDKRIFYAVRFENGEELVQEFALKKQ